jgi:hypothetical protein
VLDKKGFIEDDIYIMDPTDIETTKNCEGCGRKTVEEEHTNGRTGEMICIPKTKYGFKLLVIRDVKSGIIVAAQFAQIQESEKDYTLSLIEQAERNIGKKIRVLLLDRGFIDGLTLSTIKHKHGIDFVIPATKAMEISKDAKGLRNESGKDIWRGETEEISVIGLGGLTSYDQYGDQEHNEKNRYSKSFEGNPINVVMVTRWKDKKYEPGKEKIFLTSLRVDTPVSVIKKYKLRSLIENTTFRELKQGWLIENIPKKTENAVRTHSILTVCMYNMSKAYQSQLGKKVAEQGIRKFRTQNFGESIGKVMIISEPYYGIFDLEELCILWGKPPKYFMRTNQAEFRKEYGLLSPDSPPTTEKITNNEV